MLPERIWLLGWNKWRDFKSDTHFDGIFIAIFIFCEKCITFSHWKALNLRFWDGIQHHLTEYVMKGHFLFARLKFTHWFDFDWRSRKNNVTQDNLKVMPLTKRSNLTNWTVNWTFSIDWSRDSNFIDWFLWIFYTLNYVKITFFALPIDWSEFRIDDVKIITQIYPLRGWYSSKMECFNKSNKLKWTLLSRSNISIKSKRKKIMPHWLMMLLTLVMRWMLCTATSV